MREHRYVEAIELEKEAIKLKPDFYEAMAGAGLGYLRLGMEKEGLEWLDKAYKGDEYNVRTVNTLNLFENKIPKEYAFHGDEELQDSLPQRREAGARALPRADDGARVRRHGEALRLHAEDAGRRSSCIPTRKRTRCAPSVCPTSRALGVCFGQVITAMSPATGDINWGMVLWHELGHVFAIQLSNSRVPRWFTEGLSEYETLIARPEWRRENDADLYGAVANKTLPSIGDLNSEFMQPDQNAVVVAYFLSAVTIEYLAQTYGFPKIVEALKLYGKGKETPEVLKAITGKTIAQLDTDFRKYLDIRLAAYAGTFKLPTRGFDDVTKLEIAADAAPKDAKAQANVALGYYYGGDADKAGAAAQKALALDPKNAIARYILAEIAVHDGRLRRRPSSSTSGLIADGHDSYDLRTRLAQIAQEDGDIAEVEKQLCAAKKLDPERSYPYQALVAALQEAGQQAARRSPSSSTTRSSSRWSSRRSRSSSPSTPKLGNWPKVRTYGEMATFINPQDSEILMALGRAYLELDDGATGALHVRHGARREPAAAPSRARPPRAREGARRDGQDDGREGGARAGDEDRARERRGARAQGKLK